MIDELLIFPALFIIFNTAIIFNKSTYERKNLFEIINMFVIIMVTQFLLGNVISCYFWQNMNINKNNYINNNKIPDDSFLIYAYYLYFWFLIFRLFDVRFWSFYVYFICHFNLIFSQIKQYMFYTVVWFIIHSTREWYEWLTNEISNNQRAQFYASHD